MVCAGSLSQGSRPPLEPDRRVIERETRARQVAAFRGFTALNLNGQYSHEIMRAVAETLEPFGVRWAQPSRTVPVLEIQFTTREDPMVPKGHVLCLLTLELRTETKREANGSLAMIRHPFGLRGWTFVAESSKAGEERAIQEVRSLMQRFGEIWKESRSR